MIQRQQNKFPVFDLHCDTPVRLFWAKESLAKNTGHIDLERAQKLNGYSQFFAFCCVYDEQGKQLSQKEAERLFLSALSCFSEELEQNGNSIFLYRSTFDHAREETFGKQKAILSLEGPEVIDCDPAKLEWLYQQGFRMTTLTWNYANKLAGSCWTGEGLTDQGKEFVKEAQRLGIAIDVSHLSDKAFWDLVDITQKPILASHSNSRACCDCPRNLTDDQFKAIRDLNGVVGMNLYAPFLNVSGKATFDDVKRHLSHWLELGGGQNVALGGDLDGCDALPEGFSGLDDYNFLGNYLLSQGFDTDGICWMFNNNAAHFVLRLNGPMFP